ncbi:glycosyltransferase [Roseomonas xinghualingensis]|uniref:glycosyltransferase n=1 Tax=Roseomonas xinghualingensis TaxID=2986475 RepID=UPI0021F1F459|nr:glycosyltransferase [Roseomonas sp. SXEYE001]MCV4206153.1 glycosyltransferase [Roseomonas sp. SXEYE001]
MSGAHGKGAARGDPAAPNAAPEAPLILMLSAAHPPTDLRIVGKEGTALAAAGWRVTHLAPAPPRGAKEVPASQDGVEIVTYPRASGWFGRIRAARALARRAARLRPAVIHAHEPDSWYAAIRASRRTGAQVVLDVHEHYPSRLDTRLPGFLRGLGRFTLRGACRWMAGRADAVVVAKDGLEDAFPDIGIVPVRNYAADVPVRPREHRPGPVTLVHLGALTRERGALEMLHALALCPGGTRLSLIGRFTDSSETEFLSEAKRLGIAGTVERHGWLPHPAALARAAEGDIGLVLFQPGHENHRLALPHKLFDCMLAGIPVIVPDFAEEVAEVVREAGCGMLVNTADPDAIAEAVRALADPRLRTGMGAAGRAAALGRFGWAGEAERLVALYRNLAPLRTRPAPAPLPTVAKPAAPPPPEPGPPRLPRDATHPGGQEIPSALAARLTQAAPAPGLMARSLRNTPPQPVQGEKPRFSLIDSIQEEFNRPPGPLPAPVRPPIVTSALPKAGARLLDEAGLSGSQDLPAPVAALLARMPREAAPAAPHPPTASGIPLVEAGLQAAQPPPAPEPPPGPWRLLQAEEAPPVLPKVVEAGPQRG